MDLSTLMNIVLYLIIIGAVCWLLWWLVGYIGLPEPFNKIARGVIAVVAVILLVNMLIGFAGGQPFIRMR